MLVSAAAVAAGLTAADPFAPEAVPDGSAPFSVVPDDCSEEAPSLVDLAGATMDGWLPAEALDGSAPSSAVLDDYSEEARSLVDSAEAPMDGWSPAAVSDDSAPLDCLVPAAEVARAHSVRGTLAGRFVPAAAWGVPVPLAPVPRDSASADLQLADSVVADTPAVLRAELPVLLMVAPDDTPDLAKVQVGWPEPADLADSAAAGNSAQGMAVAPPAPVAVSAEDDCWLRAGFLVARSPLDSVDLLVLPGDSSPGWEWPVSLEAPASQLARRDRSLDASSPTPPEARRRPDVVAESAVVRRTAVVAAVASTSR